MRLEARSPATPDIFVCLPVKGNVAITGRVTHAVRCMRDAHRLLHRTFLDTKRHRNAAYLYQAT